MTKPVILCVDDESVILDSLRIELRQAFADAYDYEMAESAQEALEIIEELNQEAITILLIVSDWLMPGMYGDEFLVRVHQKFPQTIKIMLTGQATATAIDRVKYEANLFSCLYKPVDSHELVETIKAGLTQHDNSDE